MKYILGLLFSFLSVAAMQPGQQIKLMDLPSELLQLIIKQTMNYSEQCGDPFMHFADGEYLQAIAGADQIYGYADAANKTAQALRLVNKRFNRLLNNNDLLQELAQILKNKLGIAMRLELPKLIVEQIKQNATNAQVLPFHFAIDYSRVSRIGLLCACEENAFLTDEKYNNLPALSYALQKKKEIVQKLDAAKALKAKSRKTGKKMKFDTEEVMTKKLKQIDEMIGLLQGDLLRRVKKDPSLYFNQLPADLISLLKCYLKHA